MYCETYQEPKCLDIMDPNQDTNKEEINDVKKMELVMTTLITQKQNKKTIQNQLFFVLWSTPLFVQK